MSQQKPKKKKVVTTKRVEKPSTAKKKVTPNTTRTSTTVRKRKGASTRTTRSTVKAEPLAFNKNNYIIMGIGLLVMILGMVLMAGGNMPSPDVWEPERIYSFRRTVLAPFLILAGIVTQIVAIFRR